VTWLEVNGARLWIEHEGTGPVVLFVHGGLGDLRLWEPQARALSSRFHTIRYDLRFWGRSESAGVEYSPVDDLIGVLDALGVERAALVGLSLGGGIALDAVLAHPDRAWALAHVAAGVTGMPVNPYTNEQVAAYEAAETRRDLDVMMAIDFAVWAPLGSTEAYRELWRETPDAKGLPEGARSRPREPANLEAVAVPTLVIVPSGDPSAQRTVGVTAARRIPGAKLIEVDSDHYLTLREPDRVTKILEEFLSEVAPTV
jgi:pimeloyl-ACP methyl ester carboxylesterase